MHCSNGAASVEVQQTSICAHTCFCAFLCYYASVLAHYLSSLCVHRERLSQRKEALAIFIVAAAARGAAAAEAAVVAAAAVVEAVSCKIIEF